jgi:OmcA/MtrC family decaheme c-type cytochrome
MRIGLSRNWTVSLGLIAGLLLASLYLVSADGPEYTTDQLAYYADAAQVAFVRPGLVLKIISATVASDGTVAARYTVTDPQGLPLDRNGVYTPGTVGRSFVLAYIPKGKTQYVAYTTRSQTSPITGVTAIQAGTDSGGTTVDNAIGDYTYTFKTKLPTGYDKTATHTIGLYGSRSLTDFGLSTYAMDTTYSWVPSGAPVTVTRDVIKTVTCNKCHLDLSAHGTGGRKSMEVCVLCHQPQTVDPDTGNTVDMPVMIHKIHDGSSLPSVIAGKPYQIIGNAQSLHDWSTVVFPADTRRCTFCHEQNTGAVPLLEPR